MFAEKISAEMQNVQAWSGGETRELYIYPASSSYSERNFLIRLSSATVDVEESAFTDLPSYKRILTVIDGEIDLKHDDCEKIHLKSLETDCFDGGAKTFSFGKCRDFNVMIDKKSNIEASVNVIFEDKFFEVSSSKEYFFYAISGNIEIKCGDLNCEIKAGDLSHLKEIKDICHVRMLDKFSKIIFVRIC